MSQLFLWATCAVVFGSALISNADIANAQQKGRHGNFLIEVLSAAATGQCPSTMMSAMLVSACKQQMPMMGQRLAQLGKIQNAIFQDMQSTSSGAVEVYQVDFENGTMIWMINTDPSGKAMILWSPG